MHYVSNLHVEILADHQFPGAVELMDITVFSIMHTLSEKLNVIIKH